MARFFVMIAFWSVCLVLRAQVPSTAVNQAPVKAVVPDVPPSPAEKVSDSYVLGPNDEISVRCVNLDEFTDKPIRVDGDGYVTLPFVGRFRVGGLRVDQVDAELTKQLAEYIRQPQVLVNLVEARSQPVSVIGAVNTPGVQQIQGRRRLLEVLSQAGGLKPEAGRIVRVTRRVEMGGIPLPGATKDSSRQYTVAEIDVKELIDARNPAVNIEVKPNDVISVPSTALVYVVGQVRKPGGFPLHEEETMSVLQALSLAEGAQQTANTSKAKILRMDGASGRKEIAVNLSTILAGKGSDVPLQAGDILFVPNNGAKSAGMKAIDAIVNLTTGMAIYGRY
ncbi:MAG TPA: polysaccharide biosynthesis/export family protein [Bryobacteraceae bacterium]|nr:polysaccharide biosynthesis/export family protein [Bryobacteraceae bacterium]